MSDQDRKMRAASAALEFLLDGMPLGVGTGSTVNCFIEVLRHERARLGPVVSSSEATTALLAAAGIETTDLNAVGELAVYIDGADQATRRRHLIKGGGGALTREKIVAESAREFVCILDDTKLVERLGSFPLPVEVIPMARALVSRRLADLGGRPQWRTGVVTDNGNHIIDVHGLTIEDPPALEDQIDRIPGVVTVGLFALRPADVLLVGTGSGVIQV